MSKKQSSAPRNTFVGQCAAVWGHIFAYLQVREKFASRRICTWTKQLLEGPGAWREVELITTESSVALLQAVLSLYQRTTMQIASLSYGHVDPSAWFAQEIGLSALLTPRLRALDYCDEAAMPDYYDAMERWCSWTPLNIRCPNLVSLKIPCTYIFFGGGKAIAQLHSLRRLHFASNGNDRTGCYLGFICIGFCAVHDRLGRKSDGLEEGLAPLVASRVLSQLTHLSLTSEAGYRQDQYVWLNFDQQVMRLLLPNATSLVNLVIKSSTNYAGSSIDLARPGLQELTYHGHLYQTISADTAASLRTLDIISSEWEPVDLLRFHQLTSLSIRGWTSYSPSHPLVCLCRTYIWAIIKGASRRLANTHTPQGSRARPGCASD